MNQLLLRYSFAVLGLITGINYAGNKAKKNFFSKRDLAKP